MHATGLEAKRLKEDEAETAIARAYESRFNGTPAGDSVVVELQSVLSSNLSTRVISYVDNLVQQGKPQAQAVDHAVHYFGVKRSQVEDWLRKPD